MNKNRYVARAGVVLLATFGLVSCAHHHHHPDGFPGPGPGGGGTSPPVIGANGHAQCPTGPACDLTVDVDTCKVVEEKADVKRGQLIRWSAAPGSTFAVKGIEFKDPGAPFVNPRAAGSQFHWHVKEDAASKEDGYSYHVRVTGPKGQVCDFDPALWV